MMLFGALLLLLFFAGDVHPEDECSYQDVLDHLNISRNNERLSINRPVKNFKNITEVLLRVRLNAILDVVEKEQKFISCVWIVTYWQNDFIVWDPKKFCGMKSIFLPAEMLWKPDIYIDEVTEKDKSSSSPYLTVSDKGMVKYRNDVVLVTTCRMRIYQFPFDTQSCNLTFKSFIHDKELQLKPYNASTGAKWAKDLMQTQYEWLFVNMTVYFEDSKLIYTITMKRSSILYIVNFIIPIIIFLFLDLASFLISYSGGEKLGFEVTVLLAVTVLQLILNDILPSSSDAIPLIALYCIGVFALMMLSVLETILVMYLMEKDSAPPEPEADRSVTVGRRHGEMPHSPSIYDGADEAPSESVATERQSRRPLGDGPALESVADDLREIAKTLSLVHGSGRDGLRPGYWSKMARRIDTMFCIFYIVTATGFLCFLFSQWL